MIESATYHAILGGAIGWSLGVIAGIFTGGLIADYWHKPELERLKDLERYLEDDKHAPNHT